MRLYSLVFLNLLCFSLALFSKSNGTTFTFSPKQAQKISQRYPECKNQSSIFTLGQRAIITEQGLSFFIDDLILHEDIVLGSFDDLIAFAQKISEAQMSFAELEPYIIKYIKKGEKAFVALEKAFKKIQYKRWRILQIQSLAKNDPLVNQIRALRLSKENEEKVFNIYGECVNPWRNHENREEMLKPKICSAIDEYTKPKHEKQKIKLRTTNHKHEDNTTIAWRVLTNEANIIAQENQLSIPEKIVMAKCVAEKSLRFFEPATHPFKALSKIHQAHNQAPEECFFSNQGVCTNFVALAYNFGLNLGLDGNIFVAERLMHTYLEINVNGEWYHSHPFNSAFKGCDLIKF